MVITTAFQAEDVSSILTTRSVAGARLEERLIVTQKVAGADPVGHPFG